MDVAPATGDAATALAADAAADVDPAAEVAVEGDDDGTVDEAVALDAEPAAEVATSVDEAGAVAVLDAEAAPVGPAVTLPPGVALPRRSEGRLVGSRRTLLGGDGSGVGCLLLLVQAVRPSRRAARSRSGPRRHGNIVTIAAYGGRRAGRKFCAPPVLPRTSGLLVACRRAGALA